MKSRRQIQPIGGATLVRARSLPTVRRLLETACESKVRGRRAIAEATKDWRRRVRGRLRGLLSRQPMLVAMLGGLTLSLSFAGLHGWAATAALALLLAPMWWSSVRVERRSLRKSEALLRTHAHHVRELSALQGGLAHELNTPLTVVKALAGLVELDPEQGPARLQRLQAAIVRMQRLIEEHLAFSRSLTPLVPAATDLRALTRDVVDVMRLLARAKRLELRLHAPEALVVVCDRDQIAHTLMSLVENAIEASPDGERIVVRLTGLADGAVRLSVLDHGPGVPSSELAHIVEAGVTTKPGGAGLGLTLARAVARQHGGALVVENRADEGFAAHLQLPERAG